jgi:hypothetical protein
VPLQGGRGMTSSWIDRTPFGHHHRQNGDEIRSAGRLNRLHIVPGSPESVR